MSEPRTTARQHGSRERDGWYGLRRELVFLATGLCSASLTAAGRVLSLVGLGGRREDEATDYPDFDL